MREHLCHGAIGNKRYPTRFLLKTICNKFHIIIDNLLSKYDLTSTQASFLFFLVHQKEEPIQKDFEDFFQISHPAATGILSRLEEKGMITSVKSKDDKRCKKILLCEKGKHIMEKFKRYSEYEKEYIFKNFSEDEQYELDKLLKKLINNIDDAIEMEKK